MEIPLGQAPAITYAGGPRIINPNDDQFYSDRSQDDNQESEIDRAFSTFRTRIIESLPCFVDGIALHAENSPTELLISNMNTPNHLDMVEFPSSGTEFTVAISYHFTLLNSNPVLKVYKRI